MIFVCNFIIIFFLFKPSLWLFKSPCIAVSIFVVVELPQFSCVSFENKSTFYTKTTVKNGQEWWPGPPV